MVLSSPPDEEVGPGALDKTEVCWSAGECSVKVVAVGWPPTDRFAGRLAPEVQEQFVFVRVSFNYFDTNW